MKKGEDVAHHNITRKRKAKSTDIEAQATKAGPKRRRRTRRNIQRKSRNLSIRSIERTVTPNLRVDDPHKSMSLICQKKNMKIGL